MRILFDQGTPKPLQNFLPDHQIALASQMGWAMLKNGELLAAAEIDGFELLITTDRNLAYQQNLKKRSIAILVLSAGNWPRIERSVALVVQAVAQVRVGSYQEVAIPR
jgi:predicted nuclease of predicted toxin-antitoxin system